MLINRINYTTRPTLYYVPRLDKPLSSVSSVDTSLNKQHIWTQKVETPKIFNTIRFTFLLQILSDLTKMIFFHSVLFMFFFFLFIFFVKLFVFIPNSSFYRFVFLISVFYRLLLCWDSCEKKPNLPLNIFVYTYFWSLNFVDGDIFRCFVFFLYTDQKNYVSKYLERNQHLSPCVVVVVHPVLNVY